MGIKNTKQYNKRPSYPYVGRGIYGGLVLFTEPFTGFVVREGEKPVTVGDFQRNWEEINFVPIEYTVTFDLS